MTQRSDIWARLVAEKRRSTIFAACVGGFLYGVFGVLDFYIFPGLASTILPIRLAVIAYLLAFVLLLLLAFKFYVRHAQALLSSVILAAGFGIIWMNSMLAGAQYGATYYAGLILIVACVFVFLPIRFRYALALCATLIFTYDATLAFNKSPLLIAISNNFFLIGAAIICGRSCYDYEQLIYKRYAHEAVIERQKQEIEVEKARADNLLHQLLPDPIASRLMDGDLTIADGFSDVTVLFADLAGFTEFSSSVSPRNLVKILNRIFSAFDEVAQSCGVEKIKTIGDCYMAACGVPNEVDDHPERMLRMAIGMRTALQKVRGEFPNFTLALRIGIHTGPCVAGVIGRQRFIYDLWGDTVNMASRMESTGVSGQIQVTEATYLRARHAFAFESRGDVQVKGRGLIKAYLLSEQETTHG